MSDAPAWVRRFTATRLGFPTWADAWPDRLAIVTNRSGSWQVWAHDLATGSWRRASDEPVGVESARVLPDGRIAWFQDDSGEEKGRWVAQPFEGGTIEPLFPALPTGWSLGMAMAPGGRAVAGLEVAGEYRVYLVDGESENVLYASTTPAGVGCEWPDGLGGLSPDGRFAVIRHTEHGDILRPALRIVETATGGAIADIDDQPRRLEAGPWSEDGIRFAFTNELADRARPSVWDAGSRERFDLDVDLPGDVYPVQWYADGDLLVRHEFEARAQLYRRHPSGERTLVADPMGDIEDARLRPGGVAWLRASDGTAAHRTVDASGTVAFASLDPEPPGGRLLRDVWTTNPRGDRIHTLLATPDGDGPFPLVLSVHGGPEWHERHAWSAETLAYVDAGYAVALPNYRGSTGYGVAFREALVGDVCHCESGDLMSVLDELIAQAVADPDRIFWSGWSWGGCLACFNAGVNPKRWRAIFAGIPAGEFVAAHHASAPELQAWDVAVYGGHPEEVPDAYGRSNPMTYVGAVTTPIIVVAGEHDPRCPIEGVTPWIDAVRANGVEVEVHTYPAGHHANAMADQVRHLQAVLDFFSRHG
ncbi:MAG: prolyl oligopeptidase family serine peptidase [Actinomycetota bacterium]